MRALGSFLEKRIIIIPVSLDSKSQSNCIHQVKWFEWVILYPVTPRTAGFCVYIDQVFNKLNANHSCGNSDPL